MRTRRGLLRDVAAGVLAAPLAGGAAARVLAGGAATGALAGAATADAAPSRRRFGSESTTLIALIAREDAAAEAYALAAEATGDALLARLRDHDRLHSAALRTQLQALTVNVPPPPPGLAARDPDAAPLAAARTSAAARDAAIAVEQALVSAYGASTGAFVDAGLLQTVTTVMAAHAQQRVALRLAAGRPPLDGAT